MSDATGPAKATNVAQDRSTEDPKADVRPSDHADAITQSSLGPSRVESSYSDQMVQNAAPMTDKNQLSDNDKAQAGARKAQIGDDPGKREVDEDVCLAREIENEASEHLARRAAEMSLRRDEFNGSRDVHKSEERDLPAPPPPPVPPRKDKDPVNIESSGEEFDEKRPLATEETSNALPEPTPDINEPTGTEIQNIMDQFQEGGIGEEEIMSPRLERQQPILVLPPRTSSLDTRDVFPPEASESSDNVEIRPSGPDQLDKTGSVSGSSIHRIMSRDDNESTASARASSIFQPPPPSPDPDPPLSFDFQRFLEQLKHRTADPVARFLRSFLNEFGKKQWMVHEQVKIISDFLEFISQKMAQCEVWRTVSSAEFDNAREGMEKLVMNRLYSQTFSPAIPPPAGSPRKGTRGTRAQADAANPHGAGRRGQHQEDVERDGVIAQKIRIYGWISEKHLDIQPIGDKGGKFLALAQQELLKINSYRAPRDKVICVLNCCKVIFGFLKHAKADQSADAFVPLLIYTVLRARPENLVSNVQYIWRFRNQEKLGGEAGYYMSSLTGVITFIENIDRTNLTVSDEEFERNVEQAVSAIAEKDKEQEYEDKAHSTAPAGPMQYLSEKSAPSRAELTPRNSTDVERSSPRKSATQRLSEETAHGASKDSADDIDAVSGLLRTIQKPLSTIGRIFSDDSTPTQQSTGLRPASTPLPGSTPRTASPAPKVERNTSNDVSLPQRPATERERSRQGGNVEDAAARQASAEAAQAQRVRAREHRVVVETLQGMFPNLDKEVIEDVVRAQEGNVGKAVDACLALSG